MADGGRWGPSVDTDEGEDEEEDWVPPSWADPRPWVYPQPPYRLSIPHGLSRPDRVRRRWVLTVLALVLLVVAAVGAPGRDLLGTLQRSSAANPTIPASCAAPTGLASAAGGAGDGSPDAPTLALEADHAILAANGTSFASPAHVYLDRPSVSAHQADTDPALASHDPGIEQVATGTLGTSIEMVYDVVNVEVFATPADAIAYNQRIYEVRCQEGEGPIMTTSDMPGEFVEPQCSCQGSGGYSEMSMVVGNARIGIEDFLSARTEQQVEALGQEVLAATGQPDTSLPVV